MKKIGLHQMFQIESFDAKVSRYKMNARKLTFITVPI